MVSGINSEITTNKTPVIKGSYFEKKINTPLNSFNTEDEAIISSQAKLLNELDKFNSGQNSIVELAITNINCKNQVDAAIKVINTKNEMIKTVLEIGKD